MKYQYRKAPNPTEFSVFTGLGTTALDHLTLAKDVPCQAACPAKTDVPAYIQALAQKDPQKAYRINLEDNVFPSVLGRVCTRPCEDACRHTWTNVQGPVHICHLKRAGADEGAAGVQAPQAWFEGSGKRVAIIGGGPAGLTAARELRRYGHEVVLFERERHLGGMMVDGIPRFRLPLDKVEAEIQLIVDTGVRVEYGFNVDAKKLKELRTEFDAVLLAAGTMLPKALGLDAQGAPYYQGLDFMKAYNDGKIEKLDGDVVVIGGGFTAVDCSRACARAAKRLLGSDHTVTITYRRTEHHMAADLEELEEIRLEQIEIRTLSTPLRINTQGGQISSVTFQRNKLSDQLDANGKPKIVPIEGMTYDLPCKYLIVAIGQDADLSLLGDAIQLGKGVSGKVDADENPAQRTSDPKVFAAGDYLTGSNDVIHAVAEGKAAADEIDRFLSGQVRKKHHVAIQEITNETQTGRVRDHDLQRPQAMPLLTLTQRADDQRELELGFDDDSTLSHATRCYLCNHKFEINQDKCIHCNWCIEVAPRDCIKPISRLFVNKDGAPEGYTEATSKKETTHIYIDSNECIRCGKCLRVCPTGAITMRRMERVTCASHSALPGLHRLVRPAQSVGEANAANGVVGAKSGAPNSSAAWQVLNIGDRRNKIPD